MQLQLQHINQRKKLLPLLTRQEHLKALKEDEFDILVIGGGATGKHSQIGRLRLPFARPSGRTGKMS